MKTLKFASHLADLIISGQKSTTWRLFDDKDIQVGDDLIFINKDTGKEFAKAKITSVKAKPLADINEEDRAEHEKFETRDKMYETYKKYYGDKVTPDSLVKMLKFKIEEFM